MKTNVKRVQCSKFETINSPAEEIFPLLCPVLEEKWIPDWQYELVYSDSGVNEPNCIFTEETSGLFIFDTLITTTWNTIVHDPGNKKITFLLISGDRGVIRIDVAIETDKEQVSTISWHMTFTSLSSKNDDISETTIKENLVGMVTVLASLLKHYCETGEMSKP